MLINDQATGDLRLFRPKWVTLDKVNKSLKLSGRILASSLILTVFGCGSDSAKQTDPSNTSEQATPATESTQATQSTQASSPAIFSATLLSGVTFESTKVLESQPLALWFWAPGWRACKSESSSVEAAYKTFKGKVQVTGVAWNGSGGDMQDFVNENGLSFTNINDSSGEVFARFNVPYQPAWVFIAKDGTVTTRIGVLSDLELEQELNLLASN